MSDQDGLMAQVMGRKGRQRRATQTLLERGMLAALQAEQRQLQRAQDQRDQDEAQQRALAEYTRQLQSTQIDARIQEVYVSPAVAARLQRAPGLYELESLGFTPEMVAAASKVFEAETVAPPDTARQGKAWVNGERVPTRDNPLGTPEPSPILRRGPIEPGLVRRLMALAERWVPDVVPINPLSQMVNMAEVTELCRAVEPLLQRSGFQDREVKDLQAQVKRQAEEIDRLRVAAANAQGAIREVETPRGRPPDVLDEDARAELRRLARLERPEPGRMLDFENLASLLWSVEPMLDEIERLDGLLLEALTVYPCHNESHRAAHAAGTLCEDQMRIIGLALIGGLGLAPAWLPRALHQDGCSACDPAAPPYQEWLATGVFNEVGADGATEAQAPGDRPSPSATSVRQRTEA